jgi:hypothetical protein
MLFSAAIQHEQPLRTLAVADVIPRLVSSEAPGSSEPRPPRADDLPLDLDQRVRLIGEW